MFTAEQKAALEAPLSPANVKTRQQSGRTLSYIEGWQAISEANRIFGFDAWSRETVELKCVSEQPRTIGTNKAPGFGVTYIARVRVKVGEIIREGCGTGHGIDRDLGQAHESALKEAETDAMKRAMMTFGNPFGLALYDKTQANVRDEDGVPINTLPKKDAREVYTKLQNEIRECQSRDQLTDWMNGNKDRIRILPEDWQDILRSQCAEQMMDLRNREAA